MSYRKYDRVKTSVELRSPDGKVRAGTEGFVVQVNDHFLSDPDYTVEFDGGLLVPDVREKDLYQLPRPQ